MLGYFHTATFAKHKDEKNKKTFRYKMNTTAKRRRYDYMQGYTTQKKTLTIETIDQIEIYQDWVVWLENETTHYRVVSVAVEKLNELREENYTILELE